MSAAPAPRPALDPTSRSGGDVVLRLHLATATADRAGTDALEVGDVLRQLATDLVPGARADLDVVLTARTSPEDPEPERGPAGAPAPGRSAPTGRQAPDPAVLAGRDLELLLLCVHAPGPVARACVATTLWGTDDAAAQALLDEHVRRLRAVLPLRVGVLESDERSLRFRAA